MKSGTPAYLGIDYDLSPERQGRALAHFLLTYPTAEKDVQRCLLARPPFVAKARTRAMEGFEPFVRALADTLFAEQQSQIVRAYAREMLRAAHSHPPPGL